MKIDLNKIFSTLGPSCIGSNPVTVPPDCSSWYVNNDSNEFSVNLALDINGCTNSYAWFYNKPSVWTTTLTGLGVTITLDPCIGGTKPFLNVPDTVSNIDIPIKYIVQNDCCAGGASSTNEYVFRIHDRTTATLTKVDGTVLCLDVEQGTPLTYKNGSTYASPTVSVDIAKAKSLGGTSMNAYYDIKWKNNNVTSNPITIKSEASVVVPVPLPFSLNPLHIGNLTATELSTLLGTQTSGIIQLMIEAGQVSTGLCNTGDCKSTNSLNYQWYKYGNNTTFLNSAFCKNPLSTYIGGFTFDAIKWETSASDSYANVGWPNYNTPNFIYVNGNLITLTNGVTQNVTGNSVGFIAASANLENHQKPGTYYFYKASNTNPCGTLQEVKKLVYDPQVHTLNIDWVGSPSGATSYNMFVSLLDTTTLNTLANTPSKKSDLLTSINTYKGLFPTITNWASYAGFLVYPCTPNGVIARLNTGTISPSVQVSNPNLGLINGDYGFINGWTSSTSPVKYGKPINLNTCQLINNEGAFIIPIPKTATANWGTSTSASISQYRPIPLRVQLQDTCGYFSTNQLVQDWPSNTNSSNAFLIVKNINHTL